jgi:hypothetical protein
MALVKYTFRHPIQMRVAVDAEGKSLTHDDGKLVREVEPGHPIRPAREWEQNTWLQEDGSEGTA